ncbi:MAG TPA: helix-turn-helix domain-containing protein [Patescibacteria group bacterium]|nr:helix-turn-helix domain-containing protein [Patescibacteria group bacterium]
MRKISDILRTTREERDLTLDDVERDTKIKKEFIDAIEKGNYQRLPSESYATGFVKNYAKYLDIPVNEALPLFRREYNSKHNVHIVPEFRKTQHKFNRKFFSGKVFLIVAVFVIVGIYIFFQYSSLIFAPGVQVMSPKPGQTYTTNVIKVEGKTSPYASVTVNGEDVYVDLKGQFSKSVYLFQGENTVLVVATNRFGKKTNKIFNVKIK